MKKQLFSLVMMLALVIVAGSAFGAPSKQNPLIGTTYTYTWKTVNTGSSGTVSYAVTLGDATNPSTPLTDGAEFSVTTPMSFTAPTSDAVISIKWNASALVTSTSYKLWLIASTSDGCSNYRNVTITPAIDFTLEALGLRAKALDPTTLNATLGNAANNAECQILSVRDDAVLASDGSTSDGYVYLVFRAKQTFNFNKAWDATLSPSTGNVENWNGTSWVSGGAVTSIVTNTVQYFRIKVPAVVLNSTALTLTGTLVAVDANGKTDSDSSNDAIAGIIKPIPSIGIFE